MPEFPAWKRGTVKEVCLKMLTYSKVSTPAQEGLKSDQIIVLTGFYSAYIHRNK